MHSQMTQQRCGNETKMAPNSGYDNYNWYFITIRLLSFCNLAFCKRSRDYGNYCNEAITILVDGYPWNITQITYDTYDSN